MTKFVEAKLEFDKKYQSQSEFTSVVPVHLEIGKKFKIKGLKNEPNEEYYKWQFFYSLINSGLYQKDFLGAEIHFPKGNKNSAPIKFDGAIFDDPKWFEVYKNGTIKKIKNLWTGLESTCLESSNSKKKIQRMLRGYTTNNSNQL